MPPGSDGPAAGGLDFAAGVPAAERRIRSYVRQTPLERSPAFSELAGCDVRVKLENFQHTGSFKARGALHKLLSLSPAQRARGVVAASTGNHGAAVAYGLHALGLRGQIVVPETAAPGKVAAIRRWGAAVCVHGTDALDSETFARRLAQDGGLAYISPYNDPQVVLGQGTVAAELVRQWPDLEVVVAALGGGGLVSGVGGYLKALNPALRVIAASAENSPVMAESVRAGRILALPTRPTLSDATAGGLERGAITFALCQALVDDFVTVSEAEIARALLRFMDAHALLAEGAAGVALAAVLKHHAELRGRRVAVIVCGGNLGLSALKAVLGGWPLLET